MAGLENAALSGELFRHRPPSPAHSASSISSTRMSLDHATTSRSASPLPLTSRNGPQTGPKAVIEDRRVHVRQTRMNRELANEDLKLETERRALLGMTLQEEVDSREKERLLRESLDDDSEVLERRRKSRREELEVEKAMSKGYGGSERGHKRGGLREIGSEGFLVAVERPGWVVVLIYEPVRAFARSPFAEQLTRTEREYQGVKPFLHSF